MNIQNLELISNWRKSYKLWSVRLNAIGMTLMGWAFIDPSVMLSIYNMMPSELRGLVPEHVAYGIAFVLYGFAIISRLVKQPKLEGVEPPKETTGE